MIIQGRRIKRTRSPAAVIDLTLAELVEETKPLEAQDPARVAAALLLAHALQQAGMDLAVAGADGVVVVVSVPMVSWTPIAHALWQSKARRGDESQDGFREGYWNELDWVAWAPVEVQRDNAVKKGAGVFAMAVGLGRHCAAFTSDVEWLPADLALGADYHLVMPLLSGADVVAVATEVSTGQATEEFFDEYAALLTPRLLRLARRPGQTADVYLQKLRELLERDVSANAARAVTQPSKSVRERPSLDRLHGMPQAVEWGKNLAHDLRLFRAGKIAWVDVDRGLLLSGPPGCGKTLFARSLAVTCGDIPLVTGTYGEWLGTGSGHQGDLLKSMVGAFRKARGCAPSILFIDEVDSFPNRGTLTHQHADWEIQVVNALLSEIDGVQGREGVVLLAACNHPEKLDPALVRSGRLDRHVRIRLA